MNWKELHEKFFTTLSNHKSLLIYIKGSPDPDVIASSWMLKCICEKSDIKAEIFALKKPSLPQNRAIIEKLDIPIYFEDPGMNMGRFDGYAVLDFQSAYLKGISEKLPCVFHIDHHEPVHEDIDVECKISSGAVGAASTIMAMILKESRFAQDEDLLRSIGTALVYGIQTDTDNYKHARDVDFEALSFLSRYSDKEIINKISGIPLSDGMVDMIGKAIRNKIVYKGWLIAGVGLIKESVRDSIAIIADFLLQEEGVSTVIVFALVETRDHKGLVLDASFRTEDRDLDLNYLIKRITSEGGARQYKGAYQVNMDYFVHCPDRELLWQTVSVTTIEVLKKQRDNIYIAELKGVYNKFRKKIISFINRGVVLFVGVSLLGSLFSCGRKSVVNRSITPVSGSAVEVKNDGCAVIRSRFVDVAAEYVDEKMWEQFLKQRVFIKQRSKEDADIRYPRLQFFQLVVSNVSDRAVRISEIELAFGNQKKNRSLLMS
ncbi:MAG TPA: hypothetical protein PLI62_11145 [Spirochaetota bacterium]|nr:hypothetical protein [Spirochaetota bacterium]